MSNSGWVFSKALIVGVWETGKDMVEGLADLAVSGYQLLGDEKARASAWNTTEEIISDARIYGEEVIDEPAKLYHDARDGTLAIYDRFEQEKVIAEAEERLPEFYGEMTGKGLTEVGTILIPVGMAAKAGKVGKVVNATEEVAEAAKKIENVEEILDPLIKVEKVTEKPLIKALDEEISVIQKCPVRKCDKVGVKNVPLSKAKIDEIIATPKGKRPPPEEYLSADYIKNHLAQFDEGSARIVSKKGIKEFGTAGPNPSFVMPKPYVDKVIKESNGNIGKIEEALGFPKGSLDPEDMMIAEIPATKEIKIPSGNEDGANALWKPGGVTSGGVPEVVMTLPPASDLKIKPLIGE